MLGMVKMPFDNLKKEILAVNEDIVTENMLIQFLNYVPTSEEVDFFFPFLPLFLSFF